MVKLKRSQFNMNTFAEMSVSVNNLPHRDGKIFVSEEHIYIHYLDNETEVLALEIKKCCPCKYDIGPSLFEFFMEEVYVKLRFGRKNDKGSFWKLVFPYWQYQERNIQPDNSPIPTLSPPLVPQNSPVSSSSSSTE